MVVGVGSRADALERVGYLLVVVVVWDVQGFGVLRSMGSRRACLRVAVVCSARKRVRVNGRPERTPPDYVG